MDSKKWKGLSILKKSLLIVSILIFVSFIATTLPFMPIGLHLISKQIEIEKAPINSSYRYQLRYGYANIFGNEIIPCKYYKAFAFKDGMALVWDTDSYHLDDNTWSYINTSDEVIKTVHATSDGVVVGNIN